jgi:protein-tyrosine phosphatase
VERASVIADYALTEANLAGAWAERMLGKARDAGLTEPSQDVVDLMIASPAPVLTMLLERIDREYGSPTAYLRAIGLADADLARLTGILVG